jgi:rod shape-determining protein MreC
MPLTLKRTTLIIVILLLASTVLVVLDRQQRLGGITAPLTGLVTDVQRGIAPVFASLPVPATSSERELRAEVERLRAERNALLAEVARLRQAQQELDQLRAQLRFQQEHPGLQLVPARIIGFDPERPQRVFVIDRGSEAGIRIGMAVLDPNVLVGIVTRVEPDRSQVTAVTDPSIQLGAQLSESGAEGIVYGQGWRGSGLLILRHLPPDTPYRNGELVVTSGRTAGIPPGLVIGVVIGGSRQVADDELRLTVRPLVDIPSLRTASVLVSSATQ